MVSKLLGLTIALVVSLVPASASTYSFGFGSLTATGIFDSGGVLAGLDVRGLVQVDASGPGGLLGQFLMTDTALGTDPNFASLPFGNNSLVDVGPGGPLTGPFAQTFFDFLNPILSGNTLFLGATTSAPTASDPGLNALYADNPLVFIFGLTGTTPLSGGGFEAQWLLVGMGPQNSGGSTPEPGTLALVTVAVLAGWRKISISRRP